MRIRTWVEFFVFLIVMSLILVHLISEIEYFYIR
jgi:hypothetical protein